MDIISPSRSWDNKFGSEKNSCHKISRKIREYEEYWKIREKISVGLIFYSKALFFKKQRKPSY